MGAAVSRTTGGLLKYYEREAAQRSTGPRTIGSHQRILTKDAGKFPWQKTSRA